MSKKIDFSKITNTLIWIKVDAETKALWMFVLDAEKKRIVRERLIQIIHELAGEER
jgi:hypothetical protein